MKIQDKNMLYYGDNLEVMRKKIPDESVDLCYIDPPFNSKRSYNQIYLNVGEDKAQAQAFIDTWSWDRLSEHGYQEIILNQGGRFTRQTIELVRGLKNVLGENSLLAYIVSITLRIVEIQRILKPAGSFYLHCDPACSHYLKLILDTVFCPKGGDFLNEISWKRTSSHNRAKRWGPVHDVIFYYAKSNKTIWNRVLQDLDENYVKSFYRYTDSKGSYRIDNLTGPGTRTGDSGKMWKNIDPASRGRHWELPPDRALPPWFVFPEKYAQMKVQDRLDVLEAQGLIYFPKKKDGVPGFKRYLSENSGSSIQDMITDIRPVTSQGAERLGYPTQKPEALLERIIKASSNEGDTILDAYCGCGTTVAVAERLKRKWIGIDITYQSISLILKRLEDSFGKKVLKKIMLDGIPKDMDSARALAEKKDDRLRKEFEKWALLTYTNNRAVVNDKKGADKGIDGIAYFLTSPKDTGKAVFQVKSGSVKRDIIAALNNDRQREKAEIAFLLTLNPPTKPMKEEAVSAGTYHHPMMGRDYDRINIVTVEEIIENRKRFEMPAGIDVVKKAPKKSGEEQPQLA